MTHIVICRKSGVKLALSMSDTRTECEDAMSDYEPIDCADHDKLESLATRRQIARISYRAEDGGTREVEDLIEDVFARDGVEYLRTAGGEELRLDALLSVDGKRRVD
jgi:transcriptional antiterminator Rof (Rho-off)